MSRDSGALNAACNFLDRHLGEGPKPSLDVYAAADRARISRATLRRAAQGLRVKRTRRPATGPWFMCLPAVRVAPRGYPVRAAARASTRSAIDDDVGDDLHDGRYEVKEDRYESGEADSSWGWIVTIVIFLCGIGGVVLARRRFASFAIAGTNGMPLPPFTTPQPPRKYATVAPCPSDDAIYDPELTPDETLHPGPIVRLNAYGRRFATFPNAYAFAPESDTG